jgi:hypothetical protein
LCAGFVIGASNTNACPPGFSKVVLEAECRRADVGRAFTARPYGGNASANLPSGCYLATYPDATRLLFFNADPTGAPDPRMYSIEPLCAGAPLP